MERALNEYLFVYLEATNSSGRSLAEETLAKACSHVWNRSYLWQQHT